ncbi:MAG: PAS domain S-box protein [Anaerolineales bacterium]|nr:PAS domain S-box protein [Anaerolineales bacterium]
MNTLSIPVVAIASISFYVGFYHLLIYLRRRQNREDLTFALLCFAIVFYDVFCTGLYNATSVSEGAQWQRAQFIALAVFVPAFLWFVSDYTRQKPGMGTYVFSAFYLIALLVQLLDRSDLTFPPDQPSIKHITLLYSQSITYYEATLGPFSTVQGLIGIFASTYILILGIRYFRRGYKREAMPLILAIGLMYAAGLHDTFVSNGVYDSIYFIEYSYLAMILMMAYSLSNTIVEAAMAKEELRKSEERFRALVETTSDWVWEVDANGVYNYASPKVRDLLGYEPEEIIGRTPFDLMTEDEAKHISAIFQNILLHKAPFQNMENTVRHKDGQLLVLETNGVPFFDNYGRLLGYRGIGRDITERKRAEEVLRESEQKFRLFVEQSSDGLVFTDEHGIIIEWNQAQERLTGIPREESIGQPLWEVQPRLLFFPAQPGRNEALKQTFLLALQSGQADFLDKPVEVGLHHRNGTKVIVQQMAFRIKTNQGYRLGSIARDITKRKQVEEALQAKTQELDRYFTSSLDLLCIADTDGHFRRLNPEWETTLGYTIPELEGRQFLEFVHPQDVEATTLAISRLKDQQQILSFENRYRRKDGSYRWIEWRSLPIGKMIYAAARDITERKQMEAALRESEQELRESEERFRTLVEVSPTATWITKDNIITYVNPAAQQVIGAADPGEMVGRPAFDFIHPDYHAVVNERVAQMQEEGRVVSLLEEKYVRLDGGIVDVEVIAMPFVTPEGLVIQVFFQDVTKRKQAEEALRESEMRHRALVESQIDLVSRYLPDTTLTFVNDAYCKFFGKTRQELIGQSYMFMIAPEHREFVANDTKKLAEENGTITGEYINYRYDGKECWIQWVVKCITDESGHVIELQAVGRDITPLKDAEAERERLITELESKNAELERFTYTVSHDLKAPLITIRGFLGFIEQDAQSGNLDRLKEDIQRIVTASDKMQRLLDELLELSRIGRLMNPPGSIVFEDLVQEVIKMMEARLRERNVEVKIQEDLPIVFGDSQRLLEVIQNLLDNAVKFMGEQTRPVIEIGTQGEENGRPILYVRDNGIGIAPEHHERIFGLFNKLDPGAEGTGVGLAIVKRIVEVHGGRIWLESEEGKGATFYFTFAKGTRDSGVEPSAAGKT